MGKHQTQLPIQISDKTHNRLFPITNLWTCFSRTSQVSKMEISSLKTPSRGKLRLISCQWAKVRPSKIFLAQWNHQASSIPSTLHLKTSSNSNNNQTFLLSVQIHLRRQDKLSKHNFNKHSTLRDKLKISNLQVSLGSGPNNQPVLLVNLLLHKINLHSQPHLLHRHSLLNSHLLLSQLSKILDSNNFSRQIRFQSAKINLDSKQELSSNTTTTLIRKFKYQHL